MASKNSLSIRVISYNVLSSHLGAPSYYTTLNPDHLIPSKRLELVLKKLSEEISKTLPNTDSKQSNILFCLQEVSIEWAAHFHTFFAQHGYHFVTGLYGQKFNGYMGVGIAWPTTSTLDVVKVDISRLSDTRIGGWPRPPPQGEGKHSSLALLTMVPNLFKSVVTTTLQSLVMTPFQNLRRLTGKPETKSSTTSSSYSNRKNIDTWAAAENKYNQLVSVQLKERVSGKSFWLGCYHMPCVYYAPQVMTIHAELAAKRVQTLAEESAGEGAKRVPFLLAGDFNTKPDEPTYRMLTTGTLEETDKTKDPNGPIKPSLPEDPIFYVKDYYPPTKYGMEWKCTIEPMKSAYAAYLSHEPNFTNFARVGEEPPFIDTLDYIFCSSEWKVDGVRALPHRKDAGGPFPNLDLGEPSDHILIAADLTLE